MDIMVTKVPVISTASLVVLLLLLVTMESATIAFAKNGASVNIYNYVEGQSIQVKCESFGEKTLRHGEHFGWSFTPSIWGETVKSCGFKWGTRIAHFVVWVDPGDIATRVPFRPGVHLQWDALWDGFYLHDCGDQRSCFFHSWFGPSWFKWSSWFGHD